MYSTEGFAEITCTFVLERDIEGAAQDIREKVAGAIDNLPRDTLPPVITKQDPQSDPIMTVLVSGSLSRRELTEIADKQVRRAIQTVDGVGSVDLSGGQGRQIRVLLDAQKLTSHNFTVLDVRDALRRENIEAPGGRMITGPQELGLRTLGRVTSAEQFGEIVIGTRAGTRCAFATWPRSKTALRAAHLVCLLPQGCCRRRRRHRADPAAVRRQHGPRRRRCAQAT